MQTGKYHCFLGWITVLKIHKRDYKAQATRSGTSGGHGGGSSPLKFSLALPTSKHSKHSAQVRSLPAPLKVFICRGWPTPVKKKKNPGAAPEGNMASWQVCLLKHGTDWAISCLQLTGGTRAALLLYVLITTRYRSFQAQYVVMCALQAFHES